ncbi:Abi family protein [Peribacillus sp. NPDC097675]|uniref:Abi family protein n=1 Tax=Peribacillus sp. NPDC097675 TaxID=3390618 RepID=UPI003CFC584A
MSQSDLLGEISGKEKRKLTFDEMIEHLEEKNIQFNLINKVEARQMLEYSNYLYKITAYRKNFEKSKHGKYNNLEFGILYDLATIDMRLRYLVLQMSLDIEHSIKTIILSDITNNPNEDGYSIVRNFLAYTNETIDDYMHPMKWETHYNYGIYNKHHVNPPVWVLFEIITFGKFVKFVEFYSKTRDKRKYKDLEKVLKYVKNIRNSSAHNSPVLIDIAKIKQFSSPTATITSFVRKVDSITNESSRKRLSNRKTHDLTALLYVFDKYVKSKGIKDNRYKELKLLLDRCLRYKDYYASNETLVAVYKFFSKIIDFLYKPK